MISRRLIPSSNDYICNNSENEACLDKREEEKKRSVQIQYLELKIKHWINEGPWLCLSIAWTWSWRRAWTARNATRWTLSSAAPPVAPPVPSCNHPSAPLIFWARTRPPPSSTGYCYPSGPPFSKNSHPNHPQQNKTQKAENWEFTTERKWGSAGVKREVKSSMYSYFLLSLFSPPLNYGL